MFLALGLAAAGSVHAHAWLWLAAIIALLICRALLPAPETKALGALGVVIAAFAGWLVATNALANPYTSAAPYDAAFLAAGFLVGRRVRADDQAPLFKAAIAFALALAAWSIVQRATGSAPRGHALFETPATLAATLNLVFIAGLAAVAAGRRSPWLIGSLVPLAGAIIGTASRGGWLALAASAVVAVLLLRRAGIAMERGALIRSAAVLGGGGLLSLAVMPISGELAFGTAPKSVGARIELYAAAWEATQKGSLLAGVGYLGFRFVLEAARDRIEQYADAFTYFVHNDYLQVLLELGIPGFVLLAALALLPQAHAWRRLPRAAPEERLAIVALASAMASMALHALVDFPFYIPVCLLIYAVYAGRLAHGGQIGQPSAPSPLRRAVTAAVGTFAALLLLKPVAAEAALAYANTQLAHNAPRSATWLEVARRIEPRDWRYHWYLGQFWFHQAQAMRNPAAARLADEAFAAGIAADPRNVPSRLWRITAHVQLRSLLPQPADRPTLQRWVDEVARLAPREAGLKGVRRLVEDHLWSGR